MSCRPCSWRKPTTTPRQPTASGESGGMWKGMATAGPGRKRPLAQRWRDIDGCAGTSGRCADGTEVAHKLRAELGDGVLLVALTGHALEEDRRRTQEAGFNVHLAKPVELDELIRLLADPPPAAHRIDV